MYNVPTNAIVPYLLYVNAGEQDVVYNSETYTTGQTFEGVGGVSSFSYSGSGSQIVYEIEVLKGSSVEFRTLPTDADYSDAEEFIEADIEFLLNKNEQLVLDPQSLKGGGVEFVSVAQPSAPITKRIGQINTKVIYTPPTKIAYFGDSWTANGTPYPGIVNSINGIDYTNYGVGNTTVDDGGIPGSNLIDLYDSELSLGYSGQFVSFFFGTNDLAFLSSTWKATYKGIIQEFIDAGFPLDKLLICLPGKEIQPLSIELTNYVYQIAKELGIQIYDVNKRFLETGNNSGMFNPGTGHPGSLGQSVIASGYDTFIKR